MHDHTHTPLPARIGYIAAINMQCVKGPERFGVCSIRKCRALARPSSPEFVNSYQEGRKAKASSRAKVLQ